MTLNDQTQQPTTQSAQIIPRGSTVIRVDMGNLCTPPAFPFDDYPIEIRHCISREEYEKVLQDLNDLLADYNKKKTFRVGGLVVLMLIFIFGVFAVSFGSPMLIAFTAASDPNSIWDTVILTAMIIGIVLLIVLYIGGLVYFIYGIRKIRNDTIKDMRRQVVDLNESLFHDRGMSWRVGSEPIVNVVGSGRNSSVYENWNIEISLIDRV